ncbi:HAD family hydrolase [Lachnoclostridium sp. An181]|uniref:HAD family hydrolase n=1 Tax=Lachnoclostridium sp. An181 TaxID=1965575 RepID=UPI000B38BAE9|nr:HAD family phosphatase [Lachnoclostridium sp. An181]OUP50818.1 HAD family hydrolase [Lachnoclostridium sp. An181]
MKNTVIFDLGNVLVAYDWKKYLDQFPYSGETKKIIADAMFLNRTWEDGDLGVYDEESWLLAFIKNAPSHEKEIREVYANLEGTIHRFDYTDKLIQKFREKGFRIYFLSNYSEYLYRKSKEELSFIETFDGGVFSYSEKCMKPEVGIYKILLERYNIEPSNAIFYDDREENVKAAVELGMEGVVFTPNIVEEILR